MNKFSIPNHNSVAPETIARFSAKHHIARFALFGSALNEDYPNDSDLDVVVEFEPDTRIGLIRFVQIQAELSELFNRQVDLHTPASLSRYFREDVMNSARVLYAAER